MYEDGGKFVVQTRFVATYSFTCWSISTRYNKSPLVALLCLYSLFYKTLDMGWISCMQYECPINSPRLDRAALASVLAGRVNLGSIIVLTIFHFSCCNHCQVHYLNCMGILHEFWYNNGKFITPLNASASGHYFVISKIFKPIYKYEWKSTRYPASYVWSGNSGAHE